MMTRNQGPECVFCRIVSGDEPATVVYRDDRAMGIVPLEPNAPGHVVAIPYIHAANFMSDWRATHDAMYAIFAMALHLGFSDLDCNVITSKGPLATQTIQHVHFHLLPQRADNLRSLPWRNVATPEHS